MKKSILSLVLMGAFASIAHAQSSVTIYGVADVAFTRNDTNTTEPVWALTSGQQNGSRVGFRGTENLGGGTSAVFLLENGFAIDTGALQQGNRLFGRQAYIGLSSNSLGTIRLGRQYSLNHDALVVFDPFGANLAGNTEGAAIGYLGGLPYFIAGSAAGGPAVDIRVDNSIVYLTNKLGGFVGALQYAFGEQPGSFANGRQFAASATYANGPIAAVATYLTARNTTGAVEQKSYLLGGTYNFGVAKIHAGFQDNELEGGATPVESRSLLLGATVPVGPGNVLASWIRADDKNSSAKSDQVALGYTHPLSKRTNFYTSAGWQKTDLPGAPERKANVFNAGIRHLF